MIMIAGYKDARSRFFSFAGPLRDPCDRDSMFVVDFRSAGEPFGALARDFFLISLYEVKAT